LGQRRLRAGLIPKCDCLFCFISSERSRRRISASRFSKTYVDREAPDSLLDNTVLDRRNPQRPRFAISFRYVHPFDSQRLINAVPQCRRQLSLIKIRLRRKPINALSVHTSRGFVGPDFRPAQSQHTQRVEPVPGFASGPQARRTTQPKRVRYPTGCSFASGCSPPRLTATQLPSAS
jgi:hypothetical protein